MTGGRELVCMVGRDQLLLCLFLSIHPDAEDDEVAVFILNNGGRLYSGQTISSRKKELQKHKKKILCGSISSIAPSISAVSQIIF